MGRLLAEEIGSTFRDTDADVEKLAGKDISDIFLDDGEACFRAWEETAVADALEGRDGVVSLGGGAILSAATRERLRGLRVVFLSVSAAEAARRVGLSAPRPVLGLNPRADLAQLMAKRLPLYEGVSAVTVDTTGRTAEEIVALLVQ